MHITAMSDRKQRPTQSASYYNGLCVRYAWSQTENLVHVFECLCRLAQHHADVSDAKNELVEV